MSTTAERNLAERFADFLRSTQLPGDLFAADVFCDMNVPEWRFQLQGGESLAQWAKSEAPRGSDVRLGRVRAAGDIIVLETEMVTGGVFSRNLWLLRTDDAGLVDEVVFYCTGPWSAETVQRHAREAPMIRW